MKTVILCGGRGIRIRDISGDIPKPLVKIGSLPILIHIMKLYNKYNHKDFVLCLGYKSEKFVEFFKNLNHFQNDIEINYVNNEIKTISKNNFFQWKVILAHTGLDSGTGSRVYKIKDYIDDENFFITYGDGVGNINIKNLLEFHKKHKKIMTMTSVRPPSRFGEITIKKDKVVKFEEKPQTKIGRINGGFFVCNKKIFDYMNSDEGLSLEFDCLKALSKDGQLMNFSHDDFWMPMDTHREHKILNDLWKKNKKFF